MIWQAGKETHRLLLRQLQSAITVKEETEQTSTSKEELDDDELELIHARASAVSQSLEASAAEEEQPRGPGRGPSGRRASNIAQDAVSVATMDDKFFDLADRIATGKVILQGYVYIEVSTLGVTPEQPSEAPTAASPPPPAAARKTSVMGGSMKRGSIMGGKRTSVMAGSLFGRSRGSATPPNDDTKNWGKYWLKICEVKSAGGEGPATVKYVSYHASNTTREPLGIFRLNESQVVSLAMPEDPDSAVDPLSAQASARSRWPVLDLLVDASQHLLLQVPRIFPCNPCMLSALLPVPLFSLPGDADLPLT